MHKKIILLIALCIVGLPACRRVQLKQLPPIPARHETSVHVEARLLNNKETKEYLGFTLDKRSSLCAWHMLAYNPTNEELFITPQSWSVKPSSLDEMSPYIRAQHYWYIPAGLTLGVIVTTGLVITSVYSLAFAFFLPTKSFIGKSLVCLFLGTAAATPTALVATPFITYHVMNKKNTAHTEALNSRLFPIEGVIPAQSNLQGIVILPKESIAHS